MSLLKPHDEDYITRGILLLLGWCFIGMPGLALAFALVFHSAGGAFIGLLSAVALGVVGYGAYLNFGGRVQRKESAERMKLMFEDQRFQLEMKTRWQHRMGGAGAVGKQGRL